MAQSYKTFCQIFRFRLERFTHATLIIVGKALGTCPRSLPQE
jgi:hypothetical protein